MILSALSMELDAEYIKMSILTNGTFTDRLDGKGAQDLHKSQFNKLDTLGHLLELHHKEPPKKSNEIDAIVKVYHDLQKRGIVE
jgi:hypothetical protein